MGNKRKFLNEKDFPLRTEKEIFDQLELLKKIERLSINDIINEALKFYISFKIEKYNSEGV